MWSEVSTRSRSGSGTDPAVRFRPTTRARIVAGTVSPSVAARSSAGGLSAKPDASVRRRHGLPQLAVTLRLAPASPGLQASTGRGG